MVDGGVAGDLGCASMERASRDWLVWIPKGNKGLTVLSRGEPGALNRLPRGEGSFRGRGRVCKSELSALGPRYSLYRKAGSSQGWEKRPMGPNMPGK